MFTRVNPLSLLERTQVVTTDGFPRGLALDWVNRNLYWTDYELGTISFVNTDNLHKTVIIQGLQLPLAIAVDPRTDQR